MKKNTYNISRQKYLKNTFSFILVKSKFKILIQIEYSLRSEQNNTLTAPILNIYFDLYKSSLCRSFLSSE